MTEEKMLELTCLEECVTNNADGVNCYEDCDGCSEGMDRCPEICQVNCADCACCFCENVGEEDKMWWC